MMSIRDPKAIEERNEYVCDINSFQASLIFSWCLKGRVTVSTGRQKAAYWKLWFDKSFDWPINLDEDLY